MKFGSKRTTTLERIHYILDTIRITIRTKYFRFQKHNLLVMWPLHDATASFGLQRFVLLRTYGRKRTSIQRLTSVSCKKYRSAERRIAPVVHNFNISFCGACALRVPFFLVLGYNIYVRFNDAAIFA